jgi:hypothetical protein
MNPLRRRELINGRRYVRHPTAGLPAAASHVDAAVTMTSVTFPIPQPPRKSNNGLVIGLIVGALVLMICCPCLAFVAFRPASTAEIVKTLVPGD